MDPVLESANIITERKASSLTTIVAEELEKLILSGYLKPGERLNEMRLAEKFNVSRGIVREARRGLERAGLVNSLPNRGVFVKKVTREEYVENSEVRALITAFLCGKAAENAGDEEKSELQKKLIEMGKAAAQDDADAYFYLNLAFHEFILKIANHQRASAIYRDLVKDSLLARKYLLQGAVVMSKSHEEHTEIVAAIVANDKARAYQAGLAHTSKGLARWLERQDDAPQ
ncbi:FCD domain-containing protein [Halomonas sp. ML-15]|uniref:GntR family transcriptional regulator n=1 Tax=Halomonas sp. ML-15 TaxID=2773305 RepID=UPI0017470824|nr:GntR family transcriptional regulator [Halomonas sp. ML-15]MBD3896026.1 FCD domain-containing protein [Halomonas sp. ML-15]